ncbi:MAG: hypothetical protein E7587_06080 [Ruminococcaceae bacterium]|nr:hypothetical protein [Oscillospiraceae bacterium]
MNNKTRNIVVTAVFVLFMAFIVIMSGFKYANPTAESEAERRPLAQFPEELTIHGIIDGMGLEEGKDYSFGEKMARFNKSLGRSFKLIIDKTAISEFESYSVDQFPFREFFRGVKAKFQMNVLNLKENNGLAVEDGHIAKIEQDFNDGMLDFSIGRLEYVYNTYLKGKVENAYIALIPDKNYFFAKDYGYVGPDYDELINRLQTTFPQMKYINLFNSLSLDDYYRTDTHWSQDKIGDVMHTLGKEMGFEDRISYEYEKNTHHPFYGVYHGQSALKPSPDTITYLTNDAINKMKVFDYLTNSTNSVYDFEKLTGKDGYEFFLSGSKPLLRIDNPNATTDRELVLFRDSFGSSIAPLMSEGYKSVYVVDIRYVAPMIVNNMIDFEGKDVLFLYSSTILNTNAFTTQP